MDRRAVEQSKKVINNFGEEHIFDITRNGTDPYYGYLKMLWIRDNEPDNWKKIKCFLPPNSYCIYKMTGEAAIDYTSAGNIGGFFDAQNLDWSEQMIQELGMDSAKLPKRIIESSGIVGGLTDAMAKRLNLKPGTPVCAGGVDCVVAMLGLGVVKPGQHVAIIGTSMTWGFLKEGVSTENRLISMPYVVSPEENSFVFGGASTAAAINKWLRDTVAGAELYQEKETGTSAYELMDKQASEILPGSEGLIVLPYFMGERSPIWNVDAKGVIFGLTLNHTKGHIFRAFLESVAYSLKDTMDNIQNDHLERKIIISGGVAKSTLWKQIFADVTGCEVVTPKKDIEANFGDVILAGIGTGTISLDQAMTWVEFSEPVLPNKKNTEIYNRYFKQYKSIYENLKPNMTEISVIAEDCQLF
jgi:xylulokinase